MVSPLKTPEYAHPNPSGELLTFTKIAHSNPTSSGGRSVPLNPNTRTLSTQTLLGGSWRVISGGICRITVVIIHIRELIALLVATHEPPSILLHRPPRSDDTQTPLAEEEPDEDMLGPLEEEILGFYPRPLECRGLNN